MIIIGMNLLLDLASAKKKHSKSLACQSIKTGSSTNNLSIVYDVFNKNSYTWQRCEKSHKYKECWSLEHRVRSCIKKKWQVGLEGLGSILLDGGKIVHIASFIVINNNLSLLKFINIFPCLPIPPKPNTTNHFQLVDTIIKTSLLEFTISSKAYCMSRTSQQLSRLYINLPFYDPLL